MSRLNLIVNFLNMLNSSIVKEGFESLTPILEDLESKNDPEPIEIEIVNNIYAVIEKISLLESLMRTYNVKENKVVPSNKLVNLYKSKTSLFND